MQSGSTIDKHYESSYKRTCANGRSGRHRHARSAFFMEGCGFESHFAHQVAIYLNCQSDDRSELMKLKLIKLKLLKLMKLKLMKLKLMKLKLMKLMTD